MKKKKTEDKTKKTAVFMLTFQAPANIKNMKLTSKQITQIIPETERIIKPSNLIRKVGCIVENSDGVMICAQCGHEQPYTTGSTWRGTACTHCKTIFIKKAKKEE